MTRGLVLGRHPYDLTYSSLVALGVVTKRDQPSGARWLRHAYGRQVVFACSLCPDMDVGTKDYIAPVAQSGKFASVSDYNVGVHANRGVWGSMRAVVSGFMWEINHRR